MKLSSIHTHVVFDESLILEDLRDNLIDRGVYPQVVDQILKISTKDNIANWLLKAYSRTYPIPDYDVEIIKRYIGLFDKLKNKKGWPGHKDIGLYKSFATVRDHVIHYQQEMDAKTRYERAIKNSRLLGVSRNYKLIEVIEPNAASEIAQGPRGRNTAWCTAEIDCAEDYVNEGLYVLLDKKNRRIAQINHDLSEVMNTDNDTADLDSEAVALIKNSWNFDGLGDWINFASMAQRRDPELERKILNYPDKKRRTGYLFKYAAHVIDGRWQEAEDIISKNPAYAYAYASNVAKSRFPKAEPYIMKEPFVAAKYAVNILRRRWPEAEPYVLKDPEAILVYVTDILKKRWIEAEPTIMKHRAHWDMYKKMFNIEEPKNPFDYAMDA